MIPAAAVGWPVLLVVLGVDSGFSFAAAAALMGAVNVTVGVVIFQGARLLFSSLFMEREEVAKP